jgi:signal transduction histidine kinase
LNLKLVILAGVGALAQVAPVSSLSAETVAVSADGKSLALMGAPSVSIPSSAGRVAFNVGIASESSEMTRRRFQLDGVDPEWREGNGEMFVAIRFFDSKGDQVNQVSFKATGQSPGWRGKLEQSAFKHRSESIQVPARASSLWIVISSAGPPATLGILAVQGIQVSRLAEDGTREILIRAPFGRDPRVSGNPVPMGFRMDGTRPNMAQLAHIDSGGEPDCFVIVDDSAGAHAEWRTVREDAPLVAPGEHLVVEWNEAFSIGLAGSIQPAYDRPAPGVYQFRVQSLDIMGTPVGPEMVTRVNVLAPWWKRRWVWGLTMASLCVGILSLGRYVEHHRTRRQLLRLQQEQLIERERLRIAQDIHDDLGARATHISLLSAMAEEHASCPDKARASFEQISSMTRELVSALYQTVWTVNPENDNLEALANHLCQIANRLCDGAKLPCRLNIASLTGGSQVSSEVRHHVSMAVSEAIHNVVKYANASEVVVSLSAEAHVLMVAVQDDGLGFDVSATPSGNGLANMCRRLESIGGTLVIESSPQNGTRICLRVPLDSRRSEISARELSAR